MFLRTLPSSALGKKDLVYLVIYLGGVCRFKSVEYQFHMNCFSFVMKSLSKYLR